MSQLKLQVNDAKDIQQLRGGISTCIIDGREIKFFWANQADPIQNRHQNGRFFEDEELRMIAAHVRPHQVIVDIGSNVGNHAIFFEKYLNPKSVILFEVNPDAIDILRINIALNACRTLDDQYLGFALSDRMERMDRNVRDVNNIGATQFLSSKTGQYRSITGDSVLASRRVDFIKIDVEGGELAVLRGMRETLERWRPTMFIEVSDGVKAEFDAFLSEAGYEIIDKHERYVSLPNYLVKAK